MKELTTVDQVQQLISNKETCVIFKHSTTCPISAAAFDEVAEYEKNATVPIYLLKVIDDRPASNFVAEATGITHQSPQAIFVAAGAPAWNASHWSITKNSLTENVK